jgi:THO complex subunit 3
VNEAGEAVQESTLKGHKKEVRRLGWDPNNKNLVATVSADSSVKFWDVRSQTSVASVEVSTSGTSFNLAWHPAGTTLAVGTNQNAVSFIDVKSFKVMDKLKLGGLETNEMSWTAGGDLFFVATGSGAVEVLSYPDLQRINSLKSHTASVFCLAMDKRHFATGGRDAIVSLWDLDSISCVSSFSQFDSPARTLGFSHCGSYMAYASDDKAVAFVEVDTGKVIHQEQTSRSIHQLAWSPTKNMIAWVGDTDRDKGQEVLTIADARISDL